MPRSCPGFIGALGKQTLNKWDPTSIGYYWNTICDLTHQDGPDPECNYTRVLEELTRNGYTEAQVQAVFLKSADPYPQCDLKHDHCPQDGEPDAYTAERFMGNILRYLKCCKLNSQKQLTNVPRYPNLQQVFLTSRTYGGYAENFADSSDDTAGCLNPEPFAYEEGFSVQRLILAQIRQVAGITTPSDIYSGQLTYDVSPWFDWGPYLWTSGALVRSDGKFWCGGQPSAPCLGNYDVRSGALDADYLFWGDYTHPNSRGQEKVATMLKNFMVGATASDWVKVWVQE